MFATVLKAAALVAIATPAAAATFNVTFPSSVAVPANNDFIGDLAGLGLTAFSNGGSVITLDETSVLTFEFLGSESGFTDTFTAGDFTFTQGPDANAFAAPVGFGSGTFDPADFAPFFSSDQGLLAAVGTEGFGIFLPSLATASPYNSNVLYFGYDNQPSDPDDDNHDDLIVRVTATAIEVPTASTLGMTLFGLGLIGFAMRRRAA